MSFLVREKRAAMYLPRRGFLVSLIFLIRAASTDFWREARSALTAFFLAPSAKKAFASAFLVLLSRVKRASSTLETSTPATLTLVLVERECRPG